ncbi:MAG TPA: hypothetical protein P5277_05295 [Candidatus Paceibacterota bacterium]|nr:hypothetical protein [Candidatus Paceibacterota bacterium]
MKTNKKICIGMGMLLIGILVMNSVLAFAVSSKYWEKNPLTIGPGETEKAFIVLQNMAGTETVKARVTIMEGTDIAKLDNPEMIYEIPVGERVNVNFTVTIPEESITGKAVSPISPGGIYNLVFDVTTVTDSDTNSFGFGTGMQKVIPVSVVLPVAEKNTIAPWAYYLIVGTLALIITVIGILIIRNKKKK